MFTVETESNQTVVTILDTTGQMEDIEVIFDDDGVWMRQFDNSRNEYELLFLMHNQWRSLIASLDCTEGTYQIKERND